MDDEKKKAEIFLELQKIVSVGVDFDKSNTLYNCCTLISDKWNLLILITLMGETKRNSELLQQIKGISPKMLNQSLKKLLDYKLIERKLYPEVPPRVEYTITDFGRSLSEPLIALFKWHEGWKDKFEIKK
ncbi:winged helix-turn-helix transcriptional regulator [Chitinophaga sp. RAB17]|uniref:winged helix-turn-helix transcriptional regulator n=1 Tax=Chitinophaga sp. RAB17 TaxID=3233049 RepID=UPI003F8E2352